MIMALSAAANGVTGADIASGLVEASGNGTPCIGAVSYTHLTLPTK